MSGETDLARLLAGMAPEVVPGAFVFATGDPPLGAEVLATVVEDEGRSLVLRQEEAAGLDADGPFGWITLTVHSSLDAVGLTAAVATALADRSIPCNVIAGRHHDHLLVPLDRVDEAVRALRAATVVLEEVDPLAPDAQAALAAYFAELDARFPTGFDPGDAPPSDVFVLLRAGDVVAGCGGLQHLGDGTIEVKRMWTHPGWRGLGLAARLLAHLEVLARALGSTRVVLDTNGTLLEAIALYERAGYVPIERYNDNPYAERWFAKDL